MQSASEKSTSDFTTLEEMMIKVRISFISILCVVLTALSVVGQTPRLKTVLTGLSRPILIRGSGDGTNTLYIVQQTGIIKVLQPGASAPVDFINLSSKITVPASSGDERGLLGLTFHPQFASNRKFYVDYTRSGDAATVISEINATTQAERILLIIPQPFSNHNGGMIEFGPDGYLYIGMGDGGSGDDPGARAQNRAQLLGKILRIDPNVPEGSSNPYLIPPTNPYSGSGTARCDGGSTTNGTICQEIWAYGMRNPWRFSFDRGGNGDNSLWVADVGQGEIEEVDQITGGGGNFGWRVYEGNSCTGNDPQLCTGGTTPITQIPPIFQYTHASGRCSITGGYKYRGGQRSLPDGAYVYGDYCSGEIFLWNGSTQSVVADTPRSITSFGRDDVGEIYVTYSNGQIDKLTRPEASADFDGDVKTDITVFRPSNGVWYVGRSGTSSYTSQAFGVNGDIPASGDYDGDGKADLAVFRPSNSTWYYLTSSDSIFSTIQFGANGDVPVAGDYDGDSKSDLALFRPSTGVWYVLQTRDSSIRTVGWGATGDIPLNGDFDNDGISDITVWRPSNGTWYWINSTNGGLLSKQFGQTGDIPAVGDFDGDGKSDATVFRGSSGQWFSSRSVNGAFVVQSFGTPNDVPAVGDYDGDGKDDITVFRPSNGQWYTIGSTSGFKVFGPWGEPTDIPIPGHLN